MARAFLSLSTELTEAFSSAQEDVLVRALFLTIEEESIQLKSIQNVGISIEEDFDVVMAEKLSPSEASLVVFCYNGTRVSGESAKWILVAWIPDECKVRDKMLYSSSREDVKKALGLGYFVTEYYANVRDDLTWTQVLSNASKQVEGPLTEKERLIQEENKLSQVESNTTSSNAMGSLPFNLSDSVIAAFAQFKAQEINWIDMYVENEEVQLDCAKRVDTSSPLSDHISPSHGRFVAVQFPTTNSTVFSTVDFVNFFVFSCPDEIQVRMKMTMSSCKSSVLAAATLQGIKFEKYVFLFCTNLVTNNSHRTLEIRSPEDLDEALKSEMNPASATTIGASSASASLSHVKPSRPGRAASKKTSKKFVPDPDM